MHVPDFVNVEINQATWQCLSLSGAVGVRVSGFARQGCLLPCAPAPRPGPLLQIRVSRGFQIRAVPFGSARPSIVTPVVGVRARPFLLVVGTPHLSSRNEWV